MGSQNPPASFGVNGAETPVLPVASSNLSSIFEWAALFPLVIYLASNRLPHQLVGRIALVGFIPVALFPRLGVLGTIADLLQQGQEFVDRVSSVHDSRRTVWDVTWGSVFPCANGAVAEIVSAHVLRHAELQTVGEKMKSEKSTSQSEALSKESDSTTVTPKPDTTFRRYQNLHIIHFSESKDRKARDNSRLGSSDALPMVFEAFVLVGLLGISVVCCLFGIYGTGAAVFLTILFRINRQLMRVKRPEGYLQNNEGSIPGCMLVALHENASTWYLYVGSRGVIDAMLNKTMIQDFQLPLGKWNAYGLRALEILQLIIMTYVAAQKGWDGIALITLVAVAWAFDRVVYSDGRIAELWLRRHGVKAEPLSLRFSGRTPLIGAIQTLGGHRGTSWMDSILAPSTRRDAWLRRLASQDITPELEQALTQSDKSWIELNTRLTRDAEDLIPVNIKAGNHPSPTGLAV